jgi:hypothetical protein
MNDVCKLTKQDKTMRKHWLIATILCYGVQGVLCVVALSLLLYIFLAPGATQSGCQAASAVYVAGCALGLLPFYLLYRCAYRKPGTGMLSFFLILETVILLVGFIQLIQGYNDIRVGSFIFSAALIIWWSILSLRLKTLNERISRA